MRDTGFPGIAAADDLGALLPAANASKRDLRDAIDAGGPPSLSSCVDPDPSLGRSERGGDGGAIFVYSKIAGSSTRGKDQGRYSPVI